MKTDKTISDCISVPCNPLLNKYIFIIRFDMLKKVESTIS